MCPLLAIPNLCTQPHHPREHVKNRLTAWLLQIKDQNTIWVFRPSEHEFPMFLWAELL